MKISVSVTHHDETEESESHARPEVVQTMRPGSTGGHCRMALVAKPYPCRVTR